MRQKKLLSVLLAGAMVVSGGSISGLEGIIPEVAAAASSTEWNGHHYPAECDLCTVACHGRAKSGTYRDR